MKYIGLLVLAVFIQLCWSSPVEPPPLESPLKEGEVPPFEWAPNAERDLKYFHELAKTSIKDVIVFEGLPHHGWEREIYETEKKEKEWIEIAKYPFYADKRIVKGKPAKRLCDLLLDIDLFEYYGGAKFCGGFHPDFAIQIDSVVLQVCFGCHEMKLIEGGSEYIVDMKDGTGEKLKKALSKYRKQRPKSAYYSAN